MVTPPAKNAINLPASHEFYQPHANLGIDIGVNAKSYLFQFWDGEDRQGANSQAKAILDKMGCLNDYICKEQGVFVKDFAFPSQEIFLIDHTINFKKKLGDAINLESSSVL